MPEVNPEVARALIGNMPTGSLTAHNPSLRDRIAYMLSDFAGSMGAGRYAQQDIAQKTRDVVDFVPGLGEVFGLNDAWRDAAAGNYGMAAAGLGLTAMGAVPGAGDLASKLLKLSDVRRVLSSREGPLYVRWSRGPEYDMRPGAVSRDYVSGHSHDGLSAIDITGDVSDSQLLRYLRDYSFLRAKDPQIRPHFYEAKRVGTDSDNAPTIAPREYLGSLSDEMVDLLDDENNIKRISLMEQIDQNRRALEAYKINPPQFIPAWTEDTLRTLESELTELGGPLSLP